MYNFDFDQRNGVLRAAVRGFWSIDDANRYGRDLQTHVAQARRRVGHLKLLIDSSEHGVQAPEVQGRLAEIRKSAIRHPKDRVAICLVSSLARRQVARTLAGAQVALFSDPVAARAWLVGSAEHVTAAPLRPSTAA